MKIHAQPGATGPHAWTHQFDELQRLFSLSAPRRHEWTDDPRAADVIFLTNIEQPTGNVLERHPYPRQFPEKTFLISEQWEPPFQFAGIYANAPRTLFGRGRFRTGSYALHHPDFKNPFIEEYDPANAPRREPELLASFLGRNCHPLRADLFRRGYRPEEIWIEDTSQFNAFTHGANGKREQQKRYFEICLRSKFILCPRGAGPNSIRLFEALKLGIAPVIISDAWVPCEGPRWEEFALFLGEQELDRLPGLLRRHESAHAELGRRARAAHDEFFAPPAYFNFLVDRALSMRRARVVPERVFVSLWPLQRWLRRARRRSRRLIAAPQT